MKRAMKKLLVFALVLTMVASNSLTAFATEIQDGNGEVTKCTGLEDCAASEHEDTCAKAIADAQKAAEDAAKEGEDDDTTNEGSQPDDGGIMPASLEGQNVEPSGTITLGYTSSDRIWGEATGNAMESFVIEIYSKETKLFTTSLNNVNNIIDGDLYVTWSANTLGNDSDYWDVTKHVELDWKQIPDKVILYVDSVKVAENVCKLSGPDDLNPIKWWDVAGVEGAPFVIEHADGTESKFGTYDSAIDAAIDGDVVILSAGTYTLPANISSKITLKGVDKENVIIELSDYNTYASIAAITDVTFENLTINKTNNDYVGFHHSNSETYKDCIINGEVWTYATTATFENCVFNQPDASQYNVWCYGSSEVNFTECEFNCAGKSVLVYNEGAVVG